MKDVYQRYSRTEDEDDIGVDDLFGEDRDVEDDMGGVDRY